MGKIEMSDSNKWKKKGKIKRQDMEKSELPFFALCWNTLIGIFSQHSFLLVNFPLLFNSRLLTLFSFTARRNNGTLPVYFVESLHCPFTVCTGYFLYLRNRKHVLCFCRVIETRVEVWENEKCCGNTSRRRVFPQLFRVLPNFHECF